MKRQKPYCTRLIDPNESLYSSISRFLSIGCDRLVFRWYLYSSAGNYLVPMTFLYSWQAWVLCSWTTYLSTATNPYITESNIYSTTTIKPEIEVFSFGRAFIFIFYFFSTQESQSYLSYLVVAWCLIREVILYTYGDLWTGFVHYVCVCSQPGKWCWQLKPSRWTWPKELSVEGWEFLFVAARISWAGLNVS